MLQVALFDSQFLDLLPFPENGFVASEVDVGGCDVVQALVVTLIVVIRDECADLAFEIARQIVVFQQNAVLHGLVLTFYFALSLWVERCATDMLHVLPLQPFSQIARDVAGAFIAEQTRRMAHDGLVATRRSQRQFNRICHIFSPHVCAELPGNDVTAVIIQDGAEVSHWNDDPPASTLTDTSKGDN